MASIVHEARMPTLALATNNANKVREIQAILAIPNLLVCSYQEVVGYSVDVVEDGLTFEENARKKVMAYPQKDQVIYLAEDSGLEVSGLQGAPGVYSARYAGIGASSSELCDKVLKTLGDGLDRRAQFRAVMALRFSDGQIEIAEGVCKGQIATEKRGTGGFGYDPIFIPEGHSRTFAEMEAKEKNKLSHRAQALEKMKVWIASYLQD